MSETVIPCTWMRGGTSKGGLFLAEHLPPEPALRDEVLRRILGAPDERQIDGMGGGHPLTSKVAIVSPSTKRDCDIDYLFLQVQPDTGEISDRQNCGNMLAAIGPYAIEQGLLACAGEETQVRVNMLNTGARADLFVQTPNGRVTYSGSAQIDGVPGNHAPVRQVYYDTAGAQCGSLLPTKSLIDVIDDVEVTMIDNGMPIVLIRAQDIGLCGHEAISDLEANVLLKKQLEAIRLKAGIAMGLGDVGASSIPKMCLISPSLSDGIISTRTFIPHRVHQSIGVLAAASVLAACAIEGTVATGVQSHPLSSPCVAAVDHPNGQLVVEMAWDNQTILHTGFIRTARKLMQGEVFL